MPDRAYGNLMNALQEVSTENYWIAEHIFL
jgi:hypothetical protein